MKNNIISKEELCNALAAKIGRERFEKFQNARVAICGAGGLGSNVAIALARSGVGHLHIIDFDKVEATNLNRQQYKVSQIGMNKVDALRENLREIMPFCDVTTDCVRIEEGNVCELFDGDTIICEAFDGAKDKAMLVNAVLEKMPDKYLVAASGMAGMDSANNIRTKEIGRRFYLCGDFVSDVEKADGLVAPRVMLCAMHEAQAVLRIIDWDNKEGN